MRGKQMKFKEKHFVLSKENGNDDDVDREK